MWKVLKLKYGYSDADVILRIGFGSNHIHIRIEFDKENLIVFEKSGWESKYDQTKSYSFTL